MTEYSKQLANAINAMTKRGADTTLAYAAPAKRSVRDILDIGYDGVLPVELSEGDEPAQD
jgi:hypothetical protein